MDRKVETPGNLQNYAQDDLLDEYTKLYKDFISIKSLREEDIQENYELKRKIQILQNSYKDLEQELDYMTSSSRMKNSEKSSHKLEQEIEEWKKKYTENESYIQSLEVNIEKLEEEKLEIREQLQEIMANIPNEPLTKIPSEFLEKEAKLETENMLLLNKIDECQTQVNNFMMVVGEREKQIEILKDQVQCLEENYSSKKDELEEKTELLESAQEQIMELNAKVAMLSSAPDEKNRKGNSLFAEVDDQRQEMRSLLTAQKSQFLQMKKLYTESEHEIRKLKREKAAMHTELQRCMSIFLNADKFYKEKLNQRINQLTAEKDNLTKNLNSTEEQLRQIASDKNVNWMESMLDYCKKQTEEISKQLQTCRREKQIIDSRYSDSEKEMAKWRFEALKTRCIVIDRESLLEKHSIPFKIFKNADFNIGEKTIKEAVPRIAYEEVESKPSNLNESVLFEVYEDTESVVKTPLKPTTCPKMDQENSPYFAGAESAPSTSIKRSATPFKNSPFLERHLSPRFARTPSSLASSRKSPLVLLTPSRLSPQPLSEAPINTSGNCTTPTKGIFAIYEDSTTQNLANELKKLETKNQQIENPEKTEENKENELNDFVVVKKEMVTEMEDLKLENEMEIKVKQEIKSESTFVMRRILIPSSSKEKK